MPHRLCLYFDIGDHFWDASPRAADGMEFWEEYGRNLGPTAYPAQRRLARILDESTGQVVWGWRPLGGWAPLPGDSDPACSCGVQPPPPDPGDAGCADFELEDPSTTLTVEWTRWAIWDDPQDPTAPATGNQIVGYNCDETMTVCDFEIPSVAGVNADLAGKTTVVIPFLPTFDMTPVDLPLWAITFAEDRFAALGEQPLEDTRLFVGYDAANVLPGYTQADRTFGNQPSVVIAGESWHSKFTAAHEYGHQQTMAAIHAAFGPSDLNYCYHPTTYPSTDPTCDSPQHLMSSSEWQGAAAIEGMGHWYSVAAWNDVDDEECGACAVRTHYVQVNDATNAVASDVPRNSPVCPTAIDAPCPAGVNNEHDWLSALRMFRLSGSKPGFMMMFTMLATYYGTGTWIAADPSNAFWLGFDQAMTGHLGATHPDWQAAAQAWRLDR
ncbi:hypothetical protein [Paraliomyxa miuraensis]|uniref:hypothetical protein n=1 Tax=Paraliomyxa miuraensis TaxID=376150 RepID=UPI00224F24A5|nr:hypothetical protein [Paraliomyxa miuraensis]MCX4243195.1 hypothetical protein [Paraliomyxa miuraensis]